MALGYPIYVIDIDAGTNRVTVGDREATLRSALVADQLNLLSTRLAEGVELRCSAKIRYNHAPQPASARVQGERLHVTFDQAQHAITPGQAVVLYDGDVVLGGGWILSAV